MWKARLVECKALLEMCHYECGEKKILGNDTHTVNVDVSVYHEEPVLWRNKLIFSDAFKTNELQKKTIAIGSKVDLSHTARSHCTLYVV
ncbi:unnamed protein product [Toxocara canis]|uniref:MATH domain-containing protein n=1 Tax=Toxocara canis TaxID=6265 RepID=A0A183U396_TOXCA|nr:unnamed protein product [Toxocara canis]